MLQEVQQRTTTYDNPVIAERFTMLGGMCFTQLMLTYFDKLGIGKNISVIGIATVREYCKLPENINASETRILTGTACSTVYSAL